MRITPKNELDNRIRRLQERLAEAGLDGALIVQNTDLFYFAGTIQQSHLYVPVQGSPLLMTRRSLARARAESSLPHVVAITSPREMPSLLLQHGYPLPIRLGLEMDVLPANLYLAYVEIFGGVQVCDISPAIRRIRASKSKYELAAMRRAARMADATLRAMRRLLTEGVTEIELAGKLEAVARGVGHQGYARFRLFNNEMFYGHLMSGKSAVQASYLASPTGGNGLSPAFSQGSSRHKIRRGEPVFFDYIYVSDGYIIDQTRIFSIGKLPDKLVRAHSAMIEIQDAVARAAKPGRTGGELFQLATDMAQRFGYAENFGGVGKDRITFVGHGVGLEIDEYPILAKGQAMPMEANMVIAIEPKVTFPHLGTVGIENTYVVTERGAKRISRGSDEITVVKGRSSGSHDPIGKGAGK